MNVNFGYVDVEIQRIICVVLLLFVIECEVI